MMLYLRDLLLYGLVALHLVGGAALFRRLCPRESPWLAFIIPALAIAMVCNCIEHGIALTGLRWLLPVTTIGSVGLLISPKTNWRFLWKPSLVFLLSFAIPFVLRCYKPDIAQARDGIFDLCFITNFCMGDTLPPESTWMPGFKVRYYYDFTHYAASVGLRFFGLDPGTGFNVMSALLAGLILFCTAAVAYHVSRRRLWVSLLIVLMTATAMTGITDDLWLFHPDNRWPDDATNLFNRTGDATTGSPYESFLPRGKDYWCTRELIPSGYWCWMNSYHSVMGGQFLMLFALLCLVEMCNPRRTNWPWIGALWAILLLLVCSTWGVPFATTYFLVGAVLCARRKIYPRDWRFVALLVTAGCACLLPMLTYFLRVYTPPDYMPPEGPTPLLEFLMQWWPVYIPWLLLFFWWKHTHPVVRILQVLLPLFLLSIEHSNFGTRVDTTGKLWGFFFGAAWAAFVPALLALRGWASLLPRAFFLFLFAANLLAIGFWVDFYQATMRWDDVGQLTGEGDFRTDPPKGRIFNIVKTVHYKIILPGRAVWSYVDTPMLANLSYNRAFIAWCSSAGGAMNPDSFDEAPKRDAQVNEIYVDKCPDPLLYLLSNNIAMLVVWPDDNIAPDVIASLQKKLAPAYTYIDCRGLQPDPKALQAGVFVYRQPDDPNRLSPTVSYLQPNGQLRPAPISPPQN